MGTLATDSATFDGHPAGDAKSVQQGKSLGCRFLFRESIDIGYRFAGGYKF